MNTLSAVHIKASDMIVQSILGKVEYSIIVIDHHISLKELLSFVSFGKALEHFLKDMLVFDKTQVALKCGIINLEELTDEVIFNMMIMLDSEDFIKYCIASTVVQRLESPNVETTVTASYSKLLKSAFKELNPDWEY